jgi:hypothetical protein
LQPLSLAGAIHLSRNCDCARKATERLDTSQEDHVDRTREPNSGRSERGLVRSSERCRSGGRSLTTQVHSSFDSLCSLRMTDLLVVRRKNKIVS